MNVGRVLLFLVSTSAYAQPGAVQFGIPGGGEIRTKSGAASFRFSANSGDTIFARVVDCSRQGGQRVLWEPCVEIRDASNVVLGQICGGSALLPSVTLNSTGGYRLIVRDSGTQFYGGGAYASVIQRVNKPGGNVKTLKFGTEETAHLSACGQLHTYAFTAEKGKIFRLVAQMHTSAGAIPFVHVYDPEGKLVGDATLYTTSPSVIEREASASGVFTVLVHSSNSTGSYRLTLNTK